MADNKAKLDSAPDMEPVEGTVEINIPVDVLWACFTRANWWPQWNPCMFWVRNHDLVLGQNLVWAFQPIKPHYLYKLPGIARIVELEASSHVTWEVTVMPGFFARHTYFMEDLGNGRSRFGSWEKAMGSSFRALKRFWLAHFVFVKERSLAGAAHLENVYQAAGQLDFSKG